MEEKYILIVDDNPDSLEIFQTALTYLGHDIGVARNGVEALESIGNRIPDVLLLDLMMPHMNGFQVLHRLQENQATRSIPVILISAVRSEKLSQLAGVTHFIQKTEYSMTVLQDTVENVLADQSLTTDGVTLH